MADPEVTVLTGSVHTLAEAGEVGWSLAELEVLATSPRAEHVDESVGFRHEGRRRDALRFEDGWIDVEVMAMLADDVAACRPDAPHLDGPRAGCVGCAYASHRLEDP